MIELPGLNVDEMSCRVRSSKKSARKPTSSCCNRSDSSSDCSDSSGSSSYSSDSSDYSDSCDCSDCDCGGWDSTPQRKKGKRKSKGKTSQSSKGKTSRPLKGKASRASKTTKSSRPSCGPKTSKKKPSRPSKRSATTYDYNSTDSSVSDGGCGCSRGKPRRKTRG